MEGFPARKTLMARVVPLVAAMLLLAAGCGGGGGDLPSDNGAGLGGSGLLDHERAVYAGESGRNVPVIFVDRQKAAHKYSYRMEGQEYQEREILGLCRTLADSEPDAVVCIVPSGALTRDEVGLIEAKLREAGIRTVRNLGSQGGRK